MSITQVFQLAIGPYGVVVLLLLAVVWLHRQLQAEKEATGAMARDRDQWKTIALVGLSTSERASTMAAMAAEALPIPEAPQT